MKFIGLLFLLYTVLNSINVINSQSTILYKESNNMSLSKEYINIHNSFHLPSPISINIVTHPPNHPSTLCYNCPPPPQQQIPYCIPTPPSPQIINMTFPAPLINSDIIVYNI